MASRTNRTEQTFWPIVMITEWVTSNPLKGVVGRTLVDFVTRYAGSLSGRTTSSQLLTLTSVSYMAVMVLKRYYQPAPAPLQLGYEGFLTMMKRDIEQMTYLEFISKHGLKVLNVLDEDDKEALRPKFLAELETVFMGGFGVENFPYYKLDIPEQEIVTLHANCTGRKLMQQRGDIRMFIRQFDLEMANALTDKEVRDYLKIVLPAGLLQKQVTYAEIRQFFTLQEIIERPEDVYKKALRELLIESRDPQYAPDRAVLFARL